MLPAVGLGPAGVMRRGILWSAVPALGWPLGAPGGRCNAPGGFYGRLSRRWAGHWERLAGIGVRRGILDLAAALSRCCEANRGYWALGILLLGAVADHLDRAIRVQGDRLGHAAHQEPVEPVTPVRTDHQQVGWPLPGLIENHFFRAFE